jgi:signal transduction histidine kinase
MKVLNRWMQFAWIVLSGGIVALVLLIISEDSYLLFHSFIEIFTIAVAGSIFMVSWNARGYLENDYFLFVGIAYFFVAVIDLFHTLAYNGMGVFAQTGSNLATQLWISGRYMQSFTLLLAPLFCGKKLKVHWQILVYSVATGLLLTSIFYWRIFPVCYIEGIGLTPFKIISEYIVIAILGASIGLLLQKKQWFDKEVLNLLVGSIAVAMAAELAFTSYFDVYGRVSALGHILRLVSFYLAYKSIVETGLIKPQAILFHTLAQSEERLRLQADELKTRNDELNAFAHTVAHDLKNPLATIIVTIDVLSNPKMRREEWKEFFQDIKASAYHMSRIIDNLLLLAETKKEDIPLEPVDIAKVVNNVLHRLKQLIAQSEAQIKVPDSWPVVLGYAPWVEEILENYISNAIKYGGEPPIIQLGVTDESNGEACFWVQDNGNGIPLEDQSDLFKPFSQLHRRNKGHGLGLSIVRRITERMEGQIGMDSVPGKGSRFYFTLKRQTDFKPEEQELPDIIRQPEPS